MFSNYFKVAVRILTRHKLFSTINIVGLALGFACFLLTALFIGHELTYDRSFANADRIFRVAANLHLESGPSIRARTSPPMAMIVHEDFPEVEKTVRIGRSSRPLSFNDKIFFDINLYSADSAFFDLFDFPFQSGDPSTALSQPNSIVLTPKVAKMYFGNEDPLGKTMALSDTISLVVTGILKDSPDHSHLDFDCLYSRTTIVKLHQEVKDNWFSNNFYTYLLLKSPVSAGELESKFPQMLDKHMGADRKQTIWYELFLQPVTGIHLHSDLSGEIEANSSMNVIYTFGSIAMFIIALASINFMNLSTAKAAKRANEVGVRKTAGAGRSQLVFQFLGESLLLAMLAAVLAFSVVQLMLPAFNTLIGKNLAADWIENQSVLLLFLVVVIGVGLSAGLYPAFFLSRFMPIQILKGKIISGHQGAFLRKGLVVLQFAISITFISGTFVVQNQVNYMQSQDLGFDKEQLVVVSVRGTEGTTKYEVIKQKILQNPGILSVSATAEPLGRDQSRVATLPEGWDENQITSVSTVMGDPDFIKTHGIKLVAGRDFSAGSPFDVDHSFIVNEAAIKLFGWKSNEDAIGKKLDWGLGKEGHVIGVVKDFHYFSLHQQIEPLIIHIQPDAFSYLTLRIRNGLGSELKSSLASVEKEWKSLGMKGEFNYFFLDEDFARQYESDQQLQSFISYFSLIAVFIGCLGLFGLAAYTTEQRAKEIGIRKILGASGLGLVRLLSWDLLKLVIIANVLAWPIAWYILNEWLSHFAFHIEINVMVFILSGLIALLIAWFTVGFESAKAAFSNPVDSLRNE